MKPLTSAKKLIDHTIHALELLKNSLDESFDKAIETLSCSHHYIIVTGVGKSGHIGKKIAATFASTGQPSFFVHAAEANHGDLGMITHNNRLLFISNSGETKELSFMLSYKKRFHIPSVAITSAPNSTLAKNVDVCLVLPKIEEACPLGLAPTTSTTLTGVLGDALAIAMLEKKNFSASDFKIFHPGGNLGNQLSYVCDFMHPCPTLSSYSSLQECVNKIGESGFGCVAITDDDHRLIGIVTDGDLRRHYEQPLNSKIENVMTLNPITIKPQDLMVQALSLMQKHQITNVFVCDDKLKIIGILHIHDCLKNNII
jgi:arabinose-5-phosphate isomerase